MTVLTPLIVNGISRSFTDITKYGVNPENIYLGFDNSDNLSSAKTDLQAIIVLCIDSLDKRLRDKIVSTDNPHSTLSAKVFLKADFSRCVFNRKTGLFEVLEGINELSLTTMHGHYVELLETDTESKTSNDNLIDFTSDQELIIANNVLDNLKINSKQALLDATIVALNTPDKEHCGALMS